ncbi:hypothetical protein [Burkholderia pseudomallei]|uniref:hypothetical protein n=1 Tax=Burkholderia pseudomallei TaxID=28450 RepID=UPI0040631CA8
MDKPKVATVETQEQRAKSLTRTALVVMFVLFLSIPILNFLAGMAFVLWLSMAIVARSAKRAVDFGWLALGSCLCLFGFFLPFLLSGPTSSGMFQGWILEVLLNLGVAVFIATGRLGHLLFTPDATA